VSYYISLTKTQKHILYARLTTNLGDNVISDDDDNVKTLKELGLTVSQAKVYVTAVKLGKAKAKDLWKKSEVGRQEVYQILADLLELGLIEKEITKPIQFGSVPLPKGVSILINHKRNEISELEEKAKKLITKSEKNITVEPKDSEFLLLPRRYLIEGRGEISYKNVTNTIGFFCPYKRLISVFDRNACVYDDAIKRGVQMRVITEKLDAGQYEQLKKVAGPLFSRQNFILKSATPLDNMAISILDDKEVYFGLYPDKIIIEELLLWSNNPAMILLAQKYFEVVWNSAIEIKIR
jgi:sugar-specific transcriptional regulator TrmB